MKSWVKRASFLDAFGISLFSENETGCGNIVSVIGAGGKTTLLFHLAQEAKQQGARVLVTTTTKMWLPEKEQYDFFDLSGDLSFPESGTGGIFVGGIKAKLEGKMSGVGSECLLRECRHFDLVLIEADGAAGKSLKGWNRTEPVVLPETRHTIGVVDISTVGMEISEESIHRLDYFKELTSGVDGETVNLEHLQRIIEHGLFAEAVGKKYLYLNKMETVQSMENGAHLREQGADVTVVGGSVRDGMIYG